MAAIATDEESMNSTARVAVLAVALATVGCAHKINMAPKLDALDAKNVARIEKTVGYYISPADLGKEVVTPGGGGDSVRYLPYQDTEPALKHVLSSQFAKVVPVPSLEDKQFIATNRIAYIFVPVIETDSASDAAYTWPPTRFRVTVDCRAIDPAGITVWQGKVTGQGYADFNEFRSEHSLSARRASEEAFIQLQREINAATAFRQ